MILIQYCGNTITAAPEWGQHSRIWIPVAHSMERRVRRPDRAVQQGREGCDAFTRDIVSYCTDLEEQAGVKAVAMVISADLNTQRTIRIHFLIVLLSLESDLIFLPPTCGLGYSFRNLSWILRH